MIQVVWTLKALKSYFDVSDYLNEKWDISIVKMFESEVEHLIDAIKDNPKMFQASKKYKNVRKGFVSKHSTMFYRIKPRKKEIEILLFWDNRQDFRKLPY